MTHAKANTLHWYWNSDETTFIQNIHDIIKADSSNGMFMTGYKHSSQGVVDLNLCENFRSLKMAMLLDIIRPMFASMVQNGFPLQILFPYIVAILAAHGNDKLC